MEFAEIPNFLLRSARVLPTRSALVYVVAADEHTDEIATPTPRFREEISETAAGKRDSKRARFRATREISQKVSSTP